MTAPQRPQARACTWYSVTLGGGGVVTSNSCSFCTPVTRAPARPVPHRPQAAGAHTTVSSGLATWRSVDDCAPGCFPRLRPLRWRSDRSLGFLYGLSDDGGLDDVEESLRTRRLRSSTSADSRSTRAVSSPISRYASASRPASSGGGSADSSSAEGTSGTPGTPHNHRHPGPQVNNPRQRVANPPAPVNPGRAATSASCAACAPSAPQRRLPRCPSRHQGSSWIAAGIGSRPDSHATNAHASAPRRSLDGTVASSLGSAQAT